MGQIYNCEQTLITMFNFTRCSTPKLEKKNYHKNVSTTKYKIDKLDQNN